MKTLNIDVGFIVWTNKDLQDCPQVFETNAGSYSN